MAVPGLLVAIKGRGRMENLWAQGAFAIPAPIFAGAGRMGKPLRPVTAGGAVFP